MPRCAGWLSAFISAVSLFSLSCASIVQNIQGPESLTLNSAPLGAEAEVEGYGLCTTPCKFKIDKNKDFLINVSKKAHKPLSYQQVSTINLWTLGNLLGGTLGLIGVGIDWYLNHFWKITDDDLFFELDADPIDSKKNSPSPTEKPPSSAQKPSPSDPPIQPSGSPRSPEAPRALDTSPPLSPVEKKRLVELITIEETQERLTQYYGTLSPSTLKSYEDRIYRQLRDMEAEDLALDLDEAIRRDWFLHKQNPP